MALKIWTVIYPSITLFLLVVGPRLASLPLYQRTFILTFTLVPWMVFVGMPLLDMLVRRVARAGAGASPVTRTPGK
jgi:antibiotic biosynthesis monooxygenase (ABM) superfamily enzyme